MGEGAGLDVSVRGHTIQSTASRRAKQGVPEHGGEHEGVVHGHVEFEVAAVAYGSREGVEQVRGGMA